MNKSIIITVVTLMVVVMAMALAGAQAQPTPDCASKLTVCVNYLNGTKPSKECCDSIKEAVAKQLSCLCTLYTTPGLLPSLGVTVPQALSLTTNCGVPVKLDQCNAMAASPQPQATPGAGGGKNSSDKTAIAGFLTVFLFFASTLFY